MEVARAEDWRRDKAPGVSPGQSGAGRGHLGQVGGRGPGRGTNGVTGPVTGGGEVTRTVADWAGPGCSSAPEGVTMKGTEEPQV